MKEFSRKLRRNQTDAERRLWYFLRNRQFLGLKFRRQYIIVPYIVDFCCLEEKIIIELDGGQHSDQKEKDQGRDFFLKAKGFQVFRFWDNDVLRETEAVLQSLAAKISK